MTDKPDPSPKPSRRVVRRMAWPNAIVVIALASLICWVVVAFLFMGVTGDGGAPVLDLDMAPAAGPAPEQAPPKGAP